MTTWQIVVISVLEAVALLLAARLWLSKPRVSVRTRCLWSVVLLIPLVGIALYISFFNESDEELFDTYTAQELGKIVEDGRDTHHD